MLKAPESITVRRVATKADRKAFLRVPYDLYRGDTAWRPQPRLERAMQLDPKHNKLMSDITPELFLAERRGEVVGRIAAFTNARHDDLHDPDEGFFGYFDCIDDAAVGGALLASAEDWLRGQGRSRIVGPAQWSVNEEVGLLVDGFEHPNVLLTSYGRPYYAPMLEARDYAKRVDLLSFHADLVNDTGRSPAVRRLREAAERHPRVSLRKLDKRNFKRDVATALDIYNDAWSDNWNALPYTPTQVEALASELKPLMFDGSFLFVEVDGEPVAFGVVLPDVLQAVRDLDGRVATPGIVKALYRLFGKKITQGRLPLMGLKRSHQKSRLALMGLTAMCEELFEAARANGFTHLELSWVLEDNTSLIQIAQAANAEIYKRYRMYGREL